MSAATATVMTVDEATKFRTDRDAQVRQLSRKPRYELVTIYQSESGGGYTLHCDKDALVAAILNLRGFGIERLNYAIHVLHHDVVWPDCPHCNGSAS